MNQCSGFCSAVPSEFLRKVVLLAEAVEISSEESETNGGAPQQNFVLTCAWNFDVSKDH